MSCQRRLSVLLQILRVLTWKYKPCCRIQIVNIEYAELAVWPRDGTKACCVLQANSCHLKSARACLTLGLRRKQECTARPGRKQGVEAGEKVCGTGHWLECIWHALTDGRRLNQLKSNLLGSPLVMCQGESCIHSMCQRVFLQWLTLYMFDRTELNAPLPPLAAHILLTDDGVHRECMCKTDQPPCQLMRPQRINNRVETDTYYQPAVRFTRGRLVLRLLCGFR